MKLKYIHSTVIVFLILLAACTPATSEAMPAATPIPSLTVTLLPTPTIISELPAIFIMQYGGNGKEHKEYFVRPGDEIPEHLIDNEVYQNELEKMQVILEMVVNEGTISKEDVRIEIWVSEDGKSAESFLETLIDLPDLPKGSWIGYPIETKEPTDSP